MSIAENIIGTHYRYPDYFEVDREKIREFARAVKDDHPAHFTEDAARECGHDALIASLTFMAVAGRRVLGVFLGSAVGHQVRRDRRVLQVLRPLLQPLLHPWFLTFLLA